MRWRIPLATQALRLPPTRHAQVLKRGSSCPVMLQDQRRLVGVQARRCAPLWALSTQGAAALAWVIEGETVAQGVRVRQPLRGDELLARVESSGGRFVAV